MHRLGLLLAAVLGALWLLSAPVPVGPTSLVGSGARETPGPRDAHAALAMTKVPPPSIGSAPAGQLSIFAAEGGGDLVRVGRWMSPAEHDAMVENGVVQEGAGGVTSVANPADINAYMRQAAPGTRYVEFNVPADSLRQGGAPGWGIIPGPNSIFARYALSKGLPIPQFPAATDIEWVASRI